VGPGEIPAGPGEIPVGPGEIPVGPGEIPVEPGEVLVEPGEMPVGPGEMPVEPGEMPVEPGEMPVRPAEIPVGRGEVPVAPGEMPVCLPVPLPRWNHPRRACHRRSQPILKALPSEESINRGNVVSQCLLSSTLSMGIDMAVVALAAFSTVRHDVDISLYHERESAWGIFHDGSR
jgi:hypothetical protein